MQHEALLQSGARVHAAGMMRSQKRCTSARIRGSSTAAVRRSRTATTILLCSVCAAKINSKRFKRFSFSFGRGYLGYFSKIFLDIHGTFRRVLWRGRPHSPKRPAPNHRTHLCAFCFCSAPCHHVEEVFFCCCGVCALWCSGVWCAERAFLRRLLPLPPPHTMTLTLSRPLPLPLLLPMVASSW